VWDFLGSRLGDKGTEREMMEEYTQCAQASAEVFEDSLWLKLGGDLGV
jgi:hypothetical protein